MSNLVKKTFAKISFNYMSKGLDALAKCDDEVRDRLEIIPIGTVVKLSILGQKQVLNLVKTSDGFAVSKAENCDLEITFKFFASLPNVVFGKQSVTDCYLNNEFFMTGELRFAVAIVFAIEKFMQYLLSEKKYAKVYGRAPERAVKKSKIFGKLLFARRVVQ